MAETLIRLNDVSFAWPGAAQNTAVLDGLSFEVEKGDFVSLLGPSGCGKSTVLRLIAGLLQPVSGAIDSAQNAPHQRPGGTGFVFQDATLMPWADAIGNVTLPLELGGTGRDEARTRAAQALKQVGLSGAERLYPNELSGGMKMRVSLARALVTGPSLLLMDEPFAALDEMIRERLNDDLLALWRERAGGLTVIFVTHSVYEAVYLSRRVLAMGGQPGKILREIPIGAPYPRPDQFRLSPEFAQHARAVHLALGDASARL